MESGGNTCYDSDASASVYARRSRGGYAHTIGGEKNAILIDDEFIVVDEDDEEAEYCEILEREERSEAGVAVVTAGNER